MGTFCRRQAAGGVPLVFLNFGSHSLGIILTPSPEPRGPTFFQSVFEFFVALFD